MRKSIFVAGLAACAAFYGVSSSASAAGYGLGYYGGIYGHTNADRGLALYWNPARIGGDESFYGALDLSVVARRAEYLRIMTPDMVTDPTPDEAYYEYNTGLSTLNNVSLLPYLALGGGFDLGETTNLSFGGGLIPHYGGGGAPDNNPGADPAYPGAFYGPQRWSSIRSSLIVLHYTFGAAIALEELGLSFGATFEYVTATIDTSRSRNVDRTDRLTDEDENMLEGRIYFSGSDSDGNFATTIGMSYENDTVTASAVYRSSYELEMVGPLRQLYGTNEETLVEAYLQFPMPQSFLSALTVRYRDVAFTASFDYTTWSVVNRGNTRYTGDEPCPGNDTLVNSSGERMLCIPRNLVDTFSARGMVDWGVTDLITLSASIGYDPSSVPTSTLASDLPDGNKIRAGLGMIYSPNDAMRFHLSYMHDFFNGTAVLDSIQEPHANGYYTEARDYISLSIQMGL